MLEGFLICIEGHFIGYRGLQVEYIYVAVGVRVIDSILLMLSNVYLSLESIRCCVITEEQY